MLMHIRRTTKCYSPSVFSLSFSDSFKKIGLFILKLYFIILSTTLLNSFTLQNKRVACKEKTHFFVQRYT